MLSFHSLYDLVPIDFSSIENPTLVPGTQVKHVKDQRAYGIIISVDVATPRTFCVVWSRSPEIFSIADNEWVESFQQEHFRNDSWWTQEMAEKARKSGAIRGFNVKFEMTHDDCVKHIEIEHWPEPDFEFAMGDSMGRVPSRKRSL